MPILVSVIIPTYNRAQDLKRALNSLVAQSYLHWEAVIVDNHSNDNTDEVVASFNDTRIKLLKIHNNGIIAASRNKAIQNASGEYLAFLDSDDWWKPEKLDRCIAAIETGADFVYHNLYLVTSESQKFFWRTGIKRAVEQPVFQDLLKNGNPISNSSVVVKASLVDQVGGLIEDPDAVAMEDFDCWLKIAKLTENFVFLDETLGYYWVGGGNTSSPKRDLKVVAKFLELHGHNFTQTMPWWLSYTSGRAKYLLEDKEGALEAFLNIKGENVPLMVLIKKYWMTLNIKGLRS